MHGTENSRATIPTVKAPSWPYRESTNHGYQAGLHAARGVSGPFLWMVIILFSNVAAQDAHPDPQPPRISPEMSKSLALTPLSPNGSLWVDLTQKVVLVRGSVALREGLLEMFACPKHTKEHESIVVVDCRAYELHAALLAVGLEPGKPMSYQPEYQPATGPVIDIQVHWQDAKGEFQRSRAQEWIRHIQSKGTMPYEWVFAGSGFWTDDRSGNKVYYAEGGELICVSNFPTATLDIPVPSPEQNEELLFEPFTEHIPPLGTEVYLLLREKKP